jgi:hypothetical protein
MQQAESSCAHQSDQWAMDREKTTHIVIEHNAVQELILILGYRTFVAIGFPTC